MLYMNTICLFLILTLHERDITGVIYNVARAQHQVNYILTCKLTQLVLFML